MNARVWLAAGMLVVLAGCFSPFTRFQSAEESEREKDLEVRTIGDVTEVANVGAQQVSGVGLVTSLEGTGDAPQGQFRKMLEDQLRKQKVENVKALLDSPNHALVLVSGLIPAGSRKGEVIDVEITLPVGSKATSLRGGYLQECALRNFESSKHISPDKAERLLPGHILAKAHGSLLVGLGNPDEPVELRRARIWEGGISLADRPLYLLMKSDEKSVRVANAVADRINVQFRDDPQRQRAMMQNHKLVLLDDVTQQLNHQFDGFNLGQGNIAKASKDGVIAIRVPYAYRLNQQRYLRVARLVPLREDPEQHGRYRQRLQKMLLDPADTVRAALRLEALGQESIPTLKKGLASNHPLVRFTSAEALTYLGNIGGVEELARLAQRYQPLRFYCLLALANLDEAVSRTRLAELLKQPEADLRCGAFLSLRLLDSPQITGLARDQAAQESRKSLVGGELLNEEFWFHQVASQSPPLVHLSLAKRAEVVLFGDNINLVTPVKILAGPEFTITAEAHDDRCTVSRISGQGGMKQKQCALSLEAVLRTLTDLGAQYPDIVEFLRKADERHCLNCPVRINAYPEPVAIETLAEGGRDPNFLRGEE